MPAFAPADIDALFDAYPGIRTDAPRSAGSHLHERKDGLLLVLAFEAGSIGRSAELVVDFVMSRMGTGGRLDGKQPVQDGAQHACECHPSDARFFLCTRAQAAACLRALGYAMQTRYPQGLRPASGDAPLPRLLGRAFETLCKDYDRLGGADSSMPSLGVWSNVLRVIRDDGLALSDLPRRSVLSRRGARAVVRDLERLGWLVQEKRDRGATLLRPTAAGRTARDACPPLIEEAEAIWPRRFGAPRVARLREALEALVRQLPIELPWHLTGYGLADASLTGGGHIPSKPGPPRIPAHGADWPVVLRRREPAPGELPLSALLAQALAAFSIDYEEHDRGHGTNLGFVARFLRHLPDDGVALAEASEHGGVSGNGKTALERHLVVAVEPGRPRDRSRRVYPTPKARAARDAYAGLVAEVERRWRADYGHCVLEIRAALEAIDADFGDDLSEYPSTTEWFFRSMVAGSAAQRMGRGA